MGLGVRGCRGRVGHENPKSTDQNWRPPIVKFKLLEDVLHQFYGHNPKIMRAPQGVTKHSVSAKIISS